MSEIEDLLCVRTVINTTVVFNIETQPWGARSIPRKVNYGLYICSCSVRSEEYSCNTKMHLFITVNSKLCINPNVVGISLIIEKTHLFVFWRIMTHKQI